MTQSALARIAIRYAKDYHFKVDEHPQASYACSCGESFAGDYAMARDEFKRHQQVCKAVRSVDEA